ncbi:MAG TPA: hypothetical protein VLS88_05110 [Polyangiales bacterium]|nr:hypothetical protein [Polyangiales bacterium]
MTTKNQLQRSGTRLRKQGASWLDQSWEAAEMFVEESRDATVTFGQDLGAAGNKLVDTLWQATQGLQKAVHKEALDWRELAVQTRDAYIAAWKAQLGRLEQQAESTREALKPEVVEATVLESAKDLLERAAHKVDERLEQTAKPAKPAASSKARKKAPKAKSAKSKKAPAPIRDYDQLTAKDLATRVHKLPAPQVTAVLDYERARKKRATVIRAAEQRLAAAS